MSRTTVTAFDSQSTQNVTCAIPVVDVSTNYSILERDVAAGSTVLTNVSSDPSLNEFISFKATKLKEVSVHKELTKIYDPSTKEGYQFVVKDEWIARTTETDGTVHDDPEAIYIVYKTTKGANITDGSDVLGRVLRLIGVSAKVTAVTEGNDTTYTLSSDMLDRLIHGVTKPSDAN